jgi:hypothetical protein
MAAVVLTYLFLSPVDAKAVSEAADGTYTVTITKIELSKDSGATYTTVFEGSSAVNIAAVNAGAVAAGLVSGKALDPGAYNAIRVTLGSDLLVKGYINNGAGTDYTDGTTFSNNSAANDTPGTDYAISTFTIPSNQLVQTDTSTFSMVLKEGSASTATVSFNTATVIIAGPGVGPPSVAYSSK